MCSSVCVCVRVCVSPWESWPIERSVTLVFFFFFFLALCYWEHIQRLALKGGEVKSRPKESALEGLIPRTKTVVGMGQMVKRQNQSYIPRDRPVQQSGNNSSSDINRFRQVSIQVSHLEGESEAVILRISVSSSGTLVMKRGSGSDLLFKGGTRNSQIQILERGPMHQTKLVTWGRVPNKWLLSD